jgi:hypothetical protein
VKASDLYHAGVVVSDIDGARRTMSAAAGYAWTKVRASDVLVHSPEGDQVVALRVCFSTTEPYLELIEAVAGTVWEPSTSGVHHLGYWSDDVIADCDQLEAHGYAVEAWSEIGEMRIFAYCTAPASPRIELVHRSFATVLSGWITEVTGG